MSKEVILTGIRSNEEPTLGNYLGAFVPMVQLQQHYAGRYQLNMFVPDLHSFTTPIDHTTLYENTLTNLKYFIAAGLDITDEHTFLYRQSFIPAHSELTWILDCFTGFGEMSRMTQFKEKSADNNNNVTVGLFNYPVLMAADILLYNARWVPVGEDQFQHLEITRDIALRMNHKFGELFTVPEPTAKQTAFIQRDTGLRIRSLTNPEKKMSKSSTDQKSKINLADTPAQARKKIMAATTDSLGVINFDWQRQPGITNLLQLLAILTNRPQAEVNAEWVGQTQYGPLKRAVAEAVATFLTDFQTRLADISDETLLATLERSERAMNEVASITLLRVQKAVGLRSTS
ncbi:tryptophan--tRNA ligase [Candidatus Saccharibacteria bacterium]|nr:tryptophan--tRNA ligase [Candidatus Saccharibacteria bacterium]